VTQWCCRCRAVLAAVAVDACAVRVLVHWRAVGRVRAAAVRAAVAHAAVAAAAVCRASEYSYSVEEKVEECIGREYIAILTP